MSIPFYIVPYCDPFRVLVKSKSPMSISKETVIAM